MLPPSRPPTCSGRPCHSRNLALDSHVIFLHPDVRVFFFAIKHNITTRMRSTPSTTSFLMPTPSLDVLFLISPIRPKRPEQCNLLRKPTRLCLSASQISSKDLDLRMKDLLRMEHIESTLQHLLETTLPRLILIGHAGDVYYLR